MDGNMECPTCDKFLTDNMYSVHIEKCGSLSINNNYRWVYSSTFQNNWWCYDDESNKKIEKIHKDYLQRKLKSEENNKELENDVTIDIKLASTKKRGTTTKKIIINEEICFVPYCPSDDEIEFDPVEFGSGESHDILDTNKSDLKTDDILYIIKIGTANYHIDFENQKQIHALDIRKQRNIRRISLSEDDQTEKIVNFLKSEGVVGISGLKF
jgi:hypothetical protein